MIRFSKWVLRENSLRYSQYYCKQWINTIVPYIYKEAYNYYYSLWLAKQNNLDKKIEDFIPSVKKISIIKPKKKINKKTYFNFLDEESIDNV